MIHTTHISRVAAVLMKPSMVPCLGQCPIEAPVKDFISTVAVLDLRWAFQHVFCGEEEGLL